MRGDARGGFAAVGAEGALGYSVRGDETLTPGDYVLECMPLKPASAEADSRSGGAHRPPIADVWHGRSQDCGKVRVS